MVGLLLGLDSTAWLMVPALARHGFPRPRHSPHKEGGRPLHGTTAGHGTLAAQPEIR